MWGKIVSVSPSNILSLAAGPLIGLPKTIPPRSETLRHPAPVDQTCWAPSLALAMHKAPRALRSGESPLLTVTVDHTIRIWIEVCGLVPQSPEMPQFLAALVIDPPIPPSIAPANSYAARAAWAEIDPDHAEYQGSRDILWLTSLLVPRPQDAAREPEICLWAVAGLTGMDAASSSSPLIPSPSARSPKAVLWSRAKLPRAAFEPAQHAALLAAGSSKPSGGLDVPPPLPAIAYKAVAWYHENQDGHHDLNLRVTGSMVPRGTAATIATTAAAPPPPPPPPEGQGSPGYVPPSLSPASTPAARPPLVLGYVPCYPDQVLFRMVVDPADAGSAGAPAARPGPDDPPRPSSGSTGPSGGLQVHVQRLGGHAADVLASCSTEEYLATVDMDGVALLWALPELRLLSRALVPLQPPHAGTPPLVSLAFVRGGLLVITREGIGALPLHRESLGHHEYAKRYPLPLATDILWSYRCPAGSRVLVGTRLVGAMGLGVVDIRLDPGATAGPRVLMVSTHRLAPALVHVHPAPMLPGADVVAIGKSGGWLAMRLPPPEEDGNGSTPTEELARCDLAGAVASVSPGLEWDWLEAAACSPSGAEVALLFRPGLTAGCATVVFTGVLPATGDPASLSAEVIQMVHIDEEDVGQVPTWHGPGGPKELALTWHETALLGQVLAVVSRATGRVLLLRKASSGGSWERMGRWGGSGAEEAVPGVSPRCEVLSSGLPVIARGPRATLLGHTPPRVLRLLRRRMLRAAGATPHATAGLAADLAAAFGLCLPDFHPVVLGALVRGGRPDLAAAVVTALRSRLVALIHHGAQRQSLRLHGSRHPPSAVLMSASEDVLRDADILGAVPEPRRTGVSPVEQQQRPSAATSRAAPPPLESGLLDMSAFGDFESGEVPAAASARPAAASAIDSGLLDMSAFGDFGAGGMAGPPRPAAGAATSIDSGLLDMSAFGMDELGASSPSGREHATSAAALEIVEAPAEENPRVLVQWLKPAVAPLLPLEDLSGLARCFRALGLVTPDEARPYIHSTHYAYLTVDVDLEDEASAVSEECLPRSYWV